MLLPFSKRGREWEPIGVELRGLLALGSGAQLDPWQLALKVGLTVIDGNTALKNLATDLRNHLLGIGHCSWSGGVYPEPLPDGTFLCILNPNHSQRRNKITLMEEVVHTYCHHRPSGLEFHVDCVSIRHFDPQQEEEAYGV